MKRNQIWINTRVELQWNKTTQQYDEVSVEGYWADRDTVAFAHNTPTMDQDSFAFYNDGTESGSTIIGSVNANPSLPTDTTYLIRFLIQETNGGTDTNNSFQLQYNLGGAGWNNVTSTSSVVRAIASGNLTDGGATTQRIGAGTFISTNACVDSGDGNTGTVSFAGNDEVEVLYSFQIRSADVTPGAQIQLQITNGNGSTQVYTNTPTITAVVNTNVTPQDQNALQTAGGTLTLYVPQPVTPISANHNMADGADLSVTVVDQGVFINFQDQNNLQVAGGTLDAGVFLFVDPIPADHSMASGTLDAGIYNFITPIPADHSMASGTVPTKVDKTLTATPADHSMADGSVVVNASKIVSPILSDHSVSSGTLSVTRHLFVTPIAADHSLANGSLSVQADVDVNVTLQDQQNANIASTSLRILREAGGSPFVYLEPLSGLMYSPGRWGVEYRNSGSNFYINSYPFPVTILMDSAGYEVNSGTLSLNVEKTVTPIAANHNVADGSLTLNLSTNVNLAASDHNVADGTLSITRVKHIEPISANSNLANGADLVVTVLPPGIFITPQDSQTLQIADGAVVRSLNRFVSLSEGVLNVSDGSLGVNAEKSVTPVTEALTVSDGTLVINLAKNISAILSDIQLSDGSLEIGRNRNFDPITSSIQLADGSTTVFIGFPPERLIKAMSPYTTVEYTLKGTQWHAIKET